jgi:uncharacterized membrane protein
MESAIAGLAVWITGAIEILAIATVVIGALRTLPLIALAAVRADYDLAAVWRTFARWIVLALEFELAADIVRTLVAPSWADIGQLAAIAAIRTFLNYFLVLDIERTKPAQP